MRFGVGGLTKPMCDLLDNNQVDVLLDTQDFDLDAVESVKISGISESVPVNMQTLLTRRSSQQTGLCDSGSTE